VMVGMYDSVERYPVQLISHRRCGLAYFTLHAAKQGWQLPTSWKVLNFCRSVVAPNASSHRVQSLVNWFLHNILR